MDILPTKRVMLINLQPGQHIDHIIFPHGNPVRVQSEIVRIETHCNFGRVWIASEPRSLAEADLQVSDCDRAYPTKKAHSNYTDHHHSALAARLEDSSRISRSISRIAVI